MSTIIDENKVAINCVLNIKVQSGNEFILLIIQ